MPSGNPFSRYPNPIIEIAAYQPSSTDKPVDIALIPSPYAKSFGRPNTSESENRTVCLESSDQPQDTVRKKHSRTLSGSDQEANEENVEHDTTFDVGIEPQETPSTSAKATRKIDLIILPFTFLIYLSDYAQRSNLSNGAIYGLKSDVLENRHLYYALVLSSFSVTYLLCLMGANMIIPNFKYPQKALSIAVFLTSVASVTIGVASSFATVFFCRSLIGMGGAMLGKSMEVYYSSMYTGNEMAKRMSFFIGSAVLAGALNSIIAYGIGFINLSTKIWSLLYLLEGGLGILLAVICYLCLPSPNAKKKPETSPQTRLYHHESLSEINSFTLKSNPFEWRLVLSTLLNFNIWFSSFSYGCINLSVGSLTAYLPYIIESLGYSARKSQILTAWPYSVGFLAMFLVARASDRCGIRSIFVIIMCTFGGIGWAILLRYDQKPLRYFATFLVVTGAYCPIPLTLSWTLSNCTSHTQRATSFMIMQTFGQIFTIFSNFIFRTPGDDRWPQNLGFLINLVANASAALTVSCLAAWYSYQNCIQSRSRTVCNYKYL